MAKDKSIPVKRPASNGLDPVTQAGWFSRRHATSEAHDQTREQHGIARELRAEGVTSRKAARDALTARQQLNKLDRRLGKGVGATKERARLKAADTIVRRQRRAQRPTTVAKAA